MEGKALAITIAEAQERRDEATRIGAESNVLRQWYYCLGQALTEQAAQDLDEPDFSAHWLMCSDAVREHLKLAKAGLWKTETWQDAFTEFVNELVGDQLEEYGVEARLKPVVSGQSGSNRFYLLKSGQEPTYN